MFYLTTSWDDGDILDLRLSQLLNQYDVKGTFFITKNYRAKRLSEQEIRGLSDRHEIGAHTLSHPDLRFLSKEEKKTEIAGSKEWLERVTGKKVQTFCYPFGFYDRETATVTKECGFDIARTTEVGKLRAGSDLLKMPITLQVYPFPFRKYNSQSYNWRHLLDPFVKRSAPLHSIGVPYATMTSWQKVARKTIDLTRESGGVMHLWGHSWEIEKYNMWGDLKEILQYCRTLPDCKMIINREVVNYY